MINNLSTIKKKNVFSFDLSIQEQDTQILFFLFYNFFSLLIPSEPRKSKHTDCSKKKKQNPKYRKTMCGLCMLFIWNCSKEKKIAVDFGIERIFFSFHIFRFYLETILLKVGFTIFMNYFLFAVIPWVSAIHKNILLVIQSWRIFGWFMRKML